MRRVTRVVRDIDVWSVFKVGIVFHLVVFVIALVAWEAQSRRGRSDSRDGLAARRDEEPLVALIEQCLAQDPRPAYQQPTPERRYGTRLWDLDVRWHYPQPGQICVLEVQPT